MPPTAAFRPLESVNAAPSPWPFFLSSTTPFSIRFIERETELQRREMRYRDRSSSRSCHSLSIFDPFFSNGLESVTFQRSKESAQNKNEMQQKTGLVEAIIVEVKDREKIGGSYLNSDAICCTPELAKDGSCKVGEVIIHHDPDNLNEPKQIQTFFEGQSEEAKMPTEVIEINKTGLYYLYFMFCDPELKGLIISGRTVWRNLEGYLPTSEKDGTTDDILWSHVFAYLVLGLFWFLRFV